VIGSVTDSSLAGYDGIDSQSGQLTASDIDITTSGFGILGTGQTSESIVLQDAVVHVTSQAGIGVEALGKTDFTGDNVTIAGSGGQAGAVAQGVGAGNSASITLVSSIVSGFAWDILCTSGAGGTAGVVVRRSDYASKDVASCSTFLDLGGNMTATPDFVD